MQRRTVQNGSNARCRAQKFASNEAHGLGDQWGVVQSAELMPERVAEMYKGITLGLDLCQATIGGKPVWRLLRKTAWPGEEVLNDFFFGLLSSGENICWAFRSMRILG